MSTSTGAGAGAGATVRRTIEVGVDPADAFHAFTHDIGQWWQGDGEVVLEPTGLGAALSVDGTTVARVTAWEPRPRLTLSYNDGGDVDVCFEHSEVGTSVVLVHSGLRPALASERWEELLGRFARHSTERALLSRITQFVDAVNAHDVAFFEANQTDDSLCVFEDGVYSKADVVEGMRTHAPYVRFEVDQVRVLQLAAAAAVLVCDVVAQTSTATEPMRSVASYSFTRKDGAWKLALLQHTNGIA